MPYWGRVKRGGAEEHARTRPKAQTLPDRNFNSKATAATAQRRGHARAREEARRDRGAEAGDNLVSGRAWVPGPETARVPTPPGDPRRFTLERVVYPISAP